VLEKELKEKWRKSAPKVPTIPKKEEKLQTKWTKPSEIPAISQSNVGPQVPPTIVQQSPGIRGRLGPEPLVIRARHPGIRGRLGVEGLSIQRLFGRGGFTNPVPQTAPASSAFAGLGGELSQPEQPTFQRSNLFGGPQQETGLSDRAKLAYEGRYVWQSIYHYGVFPNIISNEVQQRILGWTEADMYTAGYLKKTDPSTGISYWAMPNYQTVADTVSDVYSGYTGSGYGSSGGNVYVNTPSRGPSAAYQRAPTLIMWRI